jgi:hypothetical protein
LSEGSKYLHGQKYRRDSKAVDMFEDDVLRRQYFLPTKEIEPESVRPRNFDSLPLPQAGARDASCVRSHWQIIAAFPGAQLVFQLNLS